MRADEEDEEEEEEEAFSGETSQTKVSWGDRTSQQVTALRDVQENPGEVCPVRSRMKPDPKKSKEYFAPI
ncbi:hypothetical protein AAC387_Pa12g1391 [Persea americana]